MNCIIVDDEPLAREAIELLIDKTSELKLIGTFSNARAAEKFLVSGQVDLVFLDIQMPGINGMEFAKTISDQTLIIFTTAFAEYALDGYEVEAIDYLIKPVKNDRFQKAVNKALSYHQLLSNAESKNQIEIVAEDYFFVKAERKFIKIYFKDILFIEGLKDYVVIQTLGQKIITAMNIKTIHTQLSHRVFVRVNKSFLINVQQITSFDNNSVSIGNYEIPIGNVYRDSFFNEFVAKKVITR